MRNKGQILLLIWYVKDHLVWILNLTPGDITKRAKEWLEKIQESVSGAPRIYIDNTLSIIDFDAKDFSQKMKVRKESNQLTTGYSVN